MAETEVKKINGKTICDDTAREIANSAVKTVNGVSPDNDGNVVVTAGEEQIRAYVEEILLGFTMENWTITYTDIGDALVQIPVSDELSTQWTFTMEDDSVVTKTIGYQDGVIDIEKVRTWKIPEGKVRLVQEGETVIWERAAYPEKRPFSVMSWAEIGAVCDAGLASEYWSLGDEKTIALTTGEEITFQILAFNHDIGENYETLPMTLIMMHLMEEDKAFDTSSEELGYPITWETSQIRSYLNNDICLTLPSELRAILKPARKISAAGRTTDTIQTIDKLWLLSISELGMKNNYVASEGNLYEDIQGIMNIHKFKNNGNTISGSSSSITMHGWFTRSFDVTNTSSSSKVYYVFSKFIDSTSLTSSLLAIRSKSSICFGFCV